MTCALVSMVSLLTCSMTRMAMARMLISASTTSTTRSPDLQLSMASRASRDSMMKQHWQDSATSASAWSSSITQSLSVSSAPQISHASMLRWNSASSQIKLGIQPILRIRQPCRDCGSGYTPARAILPSSRLNTRGTSSMKHRLPGSSSRTTSWEWITV